MNKYVSFIDDDDFLSATKKVVSAYPLKDIERNFMDVLVNNKNETDYIKMYFDLYSTRTTVGDWVFSELTRQSDKTVQNKIGEFHQDILGSVDGWENLHTGHPTGLDLTNEDNSIFMELKNKFNTWNSKSFRASIEDAEKTLSMYPDSVVYLAYIIEKKFNAKDEVITKNNQVINEKIRRLSGYKVYEVVTGSKNALKEVFDALPIAICDITGKSYELDERDKYIMETFREYIFK